MAGVFTLATVSTRLAAELILSSLMTIRYLIAREGAPLSAGITVRKFCYAGKHAARAGAFLLACVAG